MKVCALALAISCLFLLSGCGTTVQLRPPQINAAASAQEASASAVPTPEPSIATPTPTATPVPTIEPTPEPEPTFPLTYTEPEGTLKNPYILVRKAARVLELYDGGAQGTLVGRFKIGLGSSPIGPKEKKGDGKTPEGVYYVCSRNKQSKYYLSLGISYPSIHDAERGVEQGLISESKAREITKDINNGDRPTWSSALGGEIMIHGEGSASDWTAGCIALDNDVIDILWKHAVKGTPVEIVP